MKVYAVGGKAFFHKDELKHLGFRWYREPKLWVKPVNEATDAVLPARLTSMQGVRWDIQDLPVGEGMFRSKPAVTQPESAPAVSSLDRARKAAARAASAPASNLALAAEPEPQQDEADSLKDQAAPEYIRLRSKMKAMRMLLEEMERDLEGLHTRVER